MLVSVRGSVPHPGMYPATANMLTYDAILLAGDWRPKPVCLPAGIDSRPVRAGSEIRVAKLLDNMVFVTISSIPVAQRMVLDIPLDINRMTAEDFDRLPGIGPRLAQRIIAWRQTNGDIMKPEDLLSVEGVGEKTYLRLVKYFNYPDLKR